MLCSGLSQVEVALVLVVFSCDFWIGNCNLLNQQSKTRLENKMHETSCIFNSTKVEYLGNPSEKTWRKWRTSIPIHKEPSEIKT